MHVGILVRAPVLFGLTGFYFIYIDLSRSFMPCVYLLYLLIFLIEMFMFDFTSFIYPTFS